MVFKHLDDSQVLSRFHYHVLLYFNNPLEFKGRNVVDFSTGSHSPYVISEVSRLGANILADTMDAREICALQFVISVYIGIVKNILRTELDDLGDYLVEKDDVPDEAIFDPFKPTAIIWLGLHPTKESTPEFLWKIISQ